MDYLAALDKILIRQKVELLEVITSFETNNRYVLCDDGGRTFLMAREDTGCCTRQCCSKNRPFHFQILDMNGTPQISIRRLYSPNPFGQCCSCSRCCQDCVMVECPPGNPVGSVLQEHNCCLINFTVRDPSDQVILFLSGPSYCLCTCPGTVHSFNILTADKAMEIGKLMKVWSGLVKELLTDADNFVLQVPANMPVAHKALLIGAVLLIDFMFFEDNEAKKNPTVFM